MGKSWILILIFCLTSISCSFKKTTVLLYDNTLVHSKLSNGQKDRISNSLEFHLKVLDHQEAVAVFSLVGSDSLLLVQNNTSFKDKFDYSLQRFTKGKQAKLLIHKKLKTPEHFRTFFLNFMDTDRIIVHQMDSNLHDVSLYEVR